MYFSKGLERVKIKVISVVLFEKWINCTVKCFFMPKKIT